MLWCDDVFFFVFVFFFQRCLLLVPQSNALLELFCPPTWGLGMHKVERDSLNLRSTHVQWRKFFSHAK